MPLDPEAHCTVCIPTYNQAEYLRQAVESVVNQTAPVRLIVANDASPDHTADVLAELQQRFAFQVIDHPVNLGISTNLQGLLRAAETPFLVRLDSDDLVHPEYVAELLALMEQSPKAGYAHCAIQEIDGQGQCLGERRLARSDVFHDGDLTLKRSLFGYQVAANLLMFRREALASVNFGAGSAKVNFVEDYDLSIRLADAGWGNVYSGRVLASYRMWRGSSRPPAGRKLIEVRGITQIFTDSLAMAYERRGWSSGSLHRRRLAVALANSDVLDQAFFETGEREQLVQALVGLSGSPLLSFVFGKGRLAWAIRRFYALQTEAKLGAKRWLKRVFFRR